MSLLKKKNRPLDISRSHLKVPGKLPVNALGVRLVLAVDDIELQLLPALHKGVSEPERVGLALGEQRQESLLRGRGGQSSYTQGS